jgi:hypothetical protein
LVETGIRWLKVFAPMWIELLVFGETILAEKVY